MRTLIVNSGSSSLKLSVIGPHDRTEASVTLAGGDHGGLRSFIADHGPLDAAGHRVVHGGTDFSDPVLLDPEVTDRLARLVPLAPLHQRAALDAISAVGMALPGVPAVACFDTAFHSTMPAAASTYAVPLEWRQQWSVKRYGFHGLSHALGVPPGPRAHRAPGRRESRRHLSPRLRFVALRRAQWSLG